jgi:hypothetical protein
MSQDYKVEFPSYDDELPTIKGFVDASWHNDACPSLTKYIDDNGTFIQIFCDYKDQAISDWADLDPDNYRRFSIMLANSDADWSVAMFSSNSWEDIKDYLARFNIGGYSL